MNVKKDTLKGRRLSQKGQQRKAEKKGQNLKKVSLYEGLTAAPAVYCDQMFRGESRQIFPNGNKSPILAILNKTLALVKVDPYVLKRKTRAEKIFQLLGNVGVQRNWNAIKRERDLFWSNAHSLK